MRKLAELREQRQKVAKAMNELHQLSEKEDRGFTADEQSNWDKMEADIDKIDADIRRLETLTRIGTPEPGELRAGGREPGGHGAGTGGDNVDGEYRTAFNSFLRGGMDFLDEEQRGLLIGRRANVQEFRGLTEREQRAFAAGTGNVGGYTVPQDFLNQLEVAMRAYGGMMEAADVIRTDSGAQLPMPSFNYTNVKATIIGENQASVVDGSTPFGVANLGSFTYRSPMLPVSWEFLQDSSFGEGFIIDALARSIAWGVNEHATIGTGTGQPRGALTDAVAGKVGITGQTVTVVYPDLVDLVHSIDPSYRPQSSFMMHDQSVKVLRKVTDTNGRPIWLPGYESGIGIQQPDTLMGYAYRVNQDMPQMAANARSILFGAFKKYKLRIVRDVTMLRLVERYADNGQVAFQLFMRADGRLLDAGTNPLKFYQNSAT
jgi:HK97 family phage major capsid protein